MPISTDVSIPSLPYNSNLLAFHLSKLKTQFFFGGPLYHSIFTTVLAALLDFLLFQLLLSFPLFVVVVETRHNTTTLLPLSLSLVVLSFIIVWQFWETKMTLGISDSKVLFVVVFGILVLNCFTEIGTDAQTQTLPPDEGIYFPTH